MTSMTALTGKSWAPTKEVILKQVTTASGKPLRGSENPFMFKDVKVRKE
jgi:hypothetical protein